MKRNITKEDLASLNEGQKMSLRDLWLPEKYDLAVAYICTNAETEEYDEIEYVVGDIILNRNRITLIDIRRPKNEDNDEISEDDNNGNCNCMQNVDDDQNSNFEDDDGEYSDDEEFEDDDFEFAYEQPTTFSKEDCLPLLSITQMIEIFDRRGFKDTNFYLTASVDEKGCEIGNNTAPLEDYGNNFEPAELCDVLWDNIKLLL
ncbi:hypothetical protein [Acetivibrio cellulolyticus]|uniref:hypothetical protein n=1 Tax=Acetivibrio cellulolyticus TaxID=35830 RepID=UPI0001E2C1FA|nr:hypothetical protein [Acetivibrio cellulolyticus]